MYKRQVLGPASPSGFETALRPTIEWTTIHGAATYEVLVHRLNSRPPFLQTFSNATSMTFANDLAQGDYTVWVRAVDNRGAFSDWSEPLHFRATGGRTVITAPVAGAVVDFPTFTWISVHDAVSYEIWIAQQEGAFTLINVAGITGTSFAPIDPSLPNSEPLPDGNYRVWVRAILADGTITPWSNAVSFVGGIVVENDGESSLESSLDIQLASLNNEVTTRRAASQQPDDSVPVEVEQDSRKYVVAEPTDLRETTPNHETTAAEDATTLPADVLSKLAQECSDAEWWADNNNASA